MIRRSIRSPVFSLLLAAPLFACGSGEPEGEQAPPVAVDPDEAAIEQLRQDWVTHFNMHHAEVVAGFYTDSAWVLNADQSVSNGRAAVQASLAGLMAGAPTVDASTRGVMVFGDQAVTRGVYQVAMTPEGESATTLAGTYLNYLRKVDGRWLIEGSITNLTSTPPEGYVWGEAPATMPAEESTMQDLITGYETHWNLQHPDMVADFYAPDAEVAFANRTPVSGRDAVAAALRERALGTHIDIHGVGTIELEDGWRLDGGWYEMTAAEGGASLQTGMYLNLVQRTDDGSWKLVWTVTNGRPAAA